MRVSCIRVSTDLLVGKKRDSITSFLAKKFLGIGVMFQNLITTQNNPENIFDALKFSLSDYVLVIGESLSGRNYGIKKVISNHIGAKLIKNDACVQAVNNYFKQENLPAFVESENEYYIPENATPIISSASYMQGFVLNAEKTYIFLPDDISFIQDVFEEQLMPVFVQNSLVKYAQHTIKTFGIYEKDIYSILGDSVKNVYKILFMTYPSDLEVTILIRYNENIESEIIRNYLSKIYEKLNKFIYADEDVALATRVLEMLKITNKTLAIAESVSGGNISNVLTRENNSNLLILGFNCPNEASKIKQLGVNKSILEKYGEISVETAYEMAAGLLENSGADYVLCTTGNNTSSKTTDKKITFIAVGNEDGIHVYKNSFIGNKESIIENITQTSLFYLIKNIKQNNLNFNETIV